jgi:hypothetical protein
MKKPLFFLMPALLVTLLLQSCSGEPVKESFSDLNATTGASIQNTYTFNDLAGVWNMYSMTSTQTTVDFDQDGNRTNDLLLETDCFDPMYFDFQSDGNVNTYQSRLYFDDATGAFTCQTTGNYAATYVIEGDLLRVTFTIKGQTYTENKTILLYSENGNDFLKVTLTKEETNKVYVANDPGTTVASDLQKIEMVYIKR